MKILIASDLHGSAYWCRELITAFEREQADKLLLLGDVLYHGPRNDLPRDYAPKEVFAMLNPLADKILGVRGNCDSEVDQMVLDWPMMSDSCVLYLNGQTIFATHGHLFDAQNPPKLHKGDILLHGHTHLQVCEQVGDFWYMNPGSTSIPKGDSVNAYMTWEDGEFLWKAMEGRVCMRWVKE